MEHLIRSPEQTESSRSTSAVQVDHLSEIVKAVVAGDRSREDEFANLLTPGLRCLLARRLQTQDLDDAVQDILLTVLTQVRAGKLQNTATIPGYVRTIAMRYVGEKYQSYTRERRHLAINYCEKMEINSDSTEEQLVDAERRDFVVRALNVLPALQRDILYRFYVLGQTPEEIIAATDITETQYRLHKSRGKAALTERVKRSTRTAPAKSLARKTAGCLARLGVRIGEYARVS